MSYGMACPYTLLSDKHHFKTYHRVLHHVHVNNTVGLFVKTKSKTRPVKNGPKAYILQMKPKPNHVDLLSANSKVRLQVMLLQMNFQGW
jgi:hypothetical protein